MPIAIIPARKNSKRIKNKNIKLVYNKPLIYIVIKLLQKSKLFEKIIVSTDSEKIREISINAGAEVPFIRPKKLSNDFIGTTKVIQHAVKKLKSLNINDKYICCVYPTAILLHIKDLKKGYELIKKNKYNYVFAANKHKKSILRSFSLKGNFVDPILYKNYFKRTQDLKDTYYDIGQFYWGKSNSWTNNKKVIYNKSTIVEIPEQRSIDIDNYADFKKAKVYFQKYKDKKLT